MSTGARDPAQVPGRRRRRCEGAEAYAAGTAVTVSIEGGRWMLRGRVARGFEGGVGVVFLQEQAGRAAIAEAVEWFAGERAAA